MPGVLTMGGRGPGAVDKLDLAKARVGSGRGVACRNLLSHAQAISEVNGGIEQLGATKVGVAEIRSAPHLLLLDPRLPHCMELGPHNAGTLFIQAQVVGLCSSPSLLVSLLHAVGFRLDGREDERRYPRSVLSVALKPFRLTNRVTPFPSCFPVSLLLPLALPVAPLCAVRRSAQVSPAALVPAFCSSSGPLRLDAASTTGSAGRPVAGPVELQVFSHHTGARGKGGGAWVKKWGGACISDSLIHAQRHRGGRWEGGNRGKEGVWWPATGTGSIGSTGSIGGRNMGTAAHTCDAVLTDAAILLLSVIMPAPASSSLRFPQVPSADSTVAAAVWCCTGQLM
ncbi:unnamed protein product [Closterium sp. NIES-64]|nr:unnamed protein product [Closterium sp. NIES-64]